MERERAGITQTIDIIESIISILRQNKSLTESLMNNMNHSDSITTQKNVEHFSQTGSTHRNLYP